MTTAIRHVSLCALTVVLNSSWVFGATYYLSTNGNNNNSCTASQSASTPKATFASAWGCLNAGDTLIVQNGTYSQSANPPSGKAGAAGSPITIQAATDGGVKITQNLNLSNNSYISYVGVTIAATSNAVRIESAGSGKTSHHVTFQRFGFTCSDATMNDDACFVITDGTHHVVMEDFWGWGGGRYTLMLYGGPGGNPPNTSADSNTLRRGVLRMGPSTSSGGNPQAGLALYYSSNNIVENVIVVDSQAASDSSNSAFYLTTHAPPPAVSNNKFYGVIALNNYGIGWYLDHDGTGSNNELRNSVIWGSKGVGVALYGASSGTCSANLIDHVTSSKNGGNGFENYCKTTSVKSSIFADNSGSGLRNGSAGTMGTVNWNDVYNNSGGARTGVTAGANDISTNPNLKYITRVEASTPCSSAGEGGTQCGANVQQRYQDGVLTTQSLWPWPNESRIFKEMCVDAGVTRGFCSSSSLTDYVWSYLGNPNPFPGNLTPPNPPMNVRIIR